MTEIENYIEGWNKKCEKPVNEPEFIEMFIKLIKEYDCEHWDFSGENGYCGFTATVSDYTTWNIRSSTLINFEFAYGKDFVKVFTASHCGFWVPEYINLHGDDAKELLEIIKEKLLLWAGF